MPAWITQAWAELSSLRERVKSEPLAASTKREYERRASRLAAWEADGNKINPAGIYKKRERYLWKAAGNFARRAEVRAAMNAADKVWKAKGYASEGEKWKAYRGAVDAIWKARERLDAWEKIDFSRAVDDGRPIVGGQASHGKRPATDSQLGEFFELAKRSQYRPVFLAMELAGVRPEEFGAGVRVEVAKQGGEVGLRVVVESAKCREGHGQPVRAVFVAPPKAARADVKARYAELAGLVKASGSAGLVLKVKASESLSAGQKVSRAFSKFAAQMTDGGPKLSAYSLRHRFSSQAKASMDSPEDVARVLGHQSTETQKHYGRAHRGGGSVSPVTVKTGAGVAWEPVRSYAKTYGPKLKASVGASPPRPRL